MRLALVALAALVVACASPSVPPLRVTRYSTLAENHYPALDRSVSGVAAARRVYDAVRALPPAPKDRFCPAGFGLRYRMTFNEAADYAAKLDAHGLHDWRVPTKGELNVLFNNRAAIGGFNVSGSPPGGWYWSSSRSCTWKRGRSCLIRLASSSSASASVAVETISTAAVAAIIRAMRIACPVGRA